MNRRILFPIFKFNSYDIFPGLRFSSLSRSSTTFNYILRNWF